MACWPDVWVDDSKDAGLRLFALSRALLPPIPPDARVLEIGCHDTNWLDRAKRCDPSIQAVGIDWRQAKAVEDVTILRGDVMHADFAAASFDVIVGLSSLEHIGLGHYHHDPLDEHGDILTAQLMRLWLKPDGWAYFDVPYDATGYRVRGTKCRIYDDDALQKRLGPLTVLGYTHTERIHWIPKPAQPSGSRGFDYVACLMTKGVRGGVN